MEAIFADRLESYPRLETVAEHSWAVADSVILLAPNFPYLHRAHAVELAVLHDKMEIAIGDLNPLGRDGTGERGHAFNIDKQLDKHRREMVAIESYAQVFAEENALDKLEAFTSLNGPAHYRLPPNEERITLERKAWTAPEEIKVEGPDERALIHRGGETIQWQVAAA